MPLQGPEIGCIVMGVVLALALAALAVLLANQAACEARAKRRRAPANTALAYVAADTSASTSASTHASTHAHRFASALVNGDGGADKVHVWPSQDLRGMMEHALRTRPSLATPRTTDWVFVTTHACVAPAVADAEALARTRDALQFATAMGVDLVLLGWAGAVSARARSKLADHLWVVKALDATKGLLVLAYAVRGAAVPTLVRGIALRQFRAALFVGGSGIDGGADAFVPLLELKREC